MDAKLSKCFRDHGDKNVLRGTFISKRRKHDQMCRENYADDNDNNEFWHACTKLPFFNHQNPSTVTTTFLLLNLPSENFDRTETFNGQMNGPWNSLLEYHCGGGIGSRQTNLYAANFSSVEQANLRKSGTLLCRPPCAVRTEEA